MLSFNFSPPKIFHTSKPSKKSLQCTLEPNTASSFERLRRYTFKSYIIVFADTSGVYSGQHMETPSEITSSASIEKPPSPIQKKSALHKCVNDIKKRGAWNTKLSDMHPSLLSQCIIRPINIISPGYNQVLAIGEEFSSSSAVNLFLDNNHYQLINNAVKNPSDLIELEKAKQLESTNAPEDGNCLFAATAKYLNNLQINYASLRQKLGDWVADNPNHSLAQGFVINEII